MIVELNIKILQGNISTDLMRGDGFISLFLHPFLQLSEFNSERIIKVGPRLPR